MGQATLRQLETKRRLRVAGLMSGTSADGVDVAIVDIAPEGCRLKAFHTYAYPNALKRQVLDACSPSTSSVDLICRLNFALGELFAAAVVRLARQSRIPLRSIDLIASHGQTIHHLPPRKHKSGSTLQIGEPCVIAERTGITTVADFRPRDIAAGGQGAPLVPFADHALFTHPRLNRVLCNIGGIANITFLRAAGRLEEVIAFDTGPGNMIMDALITGITNGRRHYDNGGRLASKGVANAPVLRDLLKHPYLRRPAPKTTGREEFGADFAAGLQERCRQLALAPEDVMATACAFTAKTIELGCRALKRPIDEMILCGGGSRNHHLVGLLRRELAPTRVLVMDDLGLNADAKEAVSFAILGERTIRGMASNTPSATGANRPVVLGKIVPGR